VFLYKCFLGFYWSVNRDGHGLEFRRKTASLIRQLCTAVRVMDSSVNIGGSSS
jgi:hypothetical protein